MACQSGWTLEFSANSSSITLFNDGEKFGDGTVTDIQVPDDPNFEDEHVLVYVKKNESPAMLSLRDLDATSDFLKNFSDGVLSNSLDFVKAVLRSGRVVPANHTRKAYAAVFGSLTGLSQFNAEPTQHPRENDFASRSPSPTYSVPRMNPFADEEMEDSQEDSQDMEDSDSMLSELSSPFLSSTPNNHTANDASRSHNSFQNPLSSQEPGQRVANESKAPKNKLGKRMYGPSKGCALYESHKSVGRVIGDNLPKFAEEGWPPPFRQTVALMRTFLENHCGKAERWTPSAFSYQKGYFNRVFKLHGTSTGSGNIYLFYKVSELSDRCWELATEIMDKIEKGELQPKRRKKNVAKCNVLQTSFKCLAGKDPIKNENEIFEILQRYNDGTLEEGETKTKKSRKSEEATTSDSPVVEINELKKKLEISNEEKRNANAENKEREKDLARLNNDFSRNKKETIKLQEEFDNLKEKATKLEKALETEKKNSSYLAQCVEERDEEIHRLREEVSKAKKALLKQTSHEKQSNIEASQPASKLAARKVIEMAPAENSAKERRELKKNVDEDRNLLQSLDKELQNGEIEDNSDASSSRNEKQKKSSGKKKLKVKSQKVQDSSDKIQDTDTWDYDIDKIEINTWVTVIYDSNWYVGRVEGKNKNRGSVKINFLERRNGPKSELFGWPSTRDIQIVETRFIFRNQVNVVPRNRGFLVSEVDRIEKDAANYARKYM